MEFSAQQIASVLGGTVEGDPEVKVNNFSKIEEGKPGTLTFLANPKYEHFIYQTEASIVLVNNDFTPAEPVKATLVKVANAYAQTCASTKERLWKESSSDWRHRKYIYPVPAWIAAHARSFLEG